jgi:hypothetical protein
VNDKCNPGGCANGNGLYCGGDKVVGDANTLYQCTNGALAIVSVCANGCLVEPDGVDDKCR